MCVCVGRCSGCARRGTGSVAFAWLARCERGRPERRKVDLGRAGQTLQGLSFLRRFATDRPSPGSTCACSLRLGPKTLPGPRPDPRLRRLVAASRAALRRSVRPLALLGAQMGLAASQRLNGGVSARTRARTRPLLGVGSSPLLLEMGGARLPSLARPSASRSVLEAAQLALASLSPSRATRPGRMPLAPPLVTRDLTVRPPRRPSARSPRPPPRPASTN